MYVLYVLDVFIFILFIIKINYWLSSVEAIQSNPQLFTDGLNIPNMQMSHLRRLSDISIHSTMSGMVENVPLQVVSNCK